MWYGYTMNKPKSSQAGTITLANGTTHQAFLNTYQDTVFSADGTTGTLVTTSRVEFLLGTNGAYSTGRKYRKATPKQAATFKPNQD